MQGQLTAIADSLAPDTVIAVLEQHQPLLITVINATVALSTVVIAIFALVMWQLARKRAAEARLALDAELRVRANNAKREIAGWIAPARLAGGPDTEWALKFLKKGGTTSQLMEDLVIRAPGASVSVTANIRTAYLYYGWALDRASQVATTRGSKEASQLYDALERCFGKLREVIGKTLREEEAALGQEIGALKATASGRDDS